MERQISHRHASSSGSSGIHALSMKNKPHHNLLPHPLPNCSCLQRDLMSMSFPNLLKVAKQLKHAGVITTLRLFVSLNEQHIVNQRFSSLDPRTTDAVFEFTRALSRAIEGWMHDVEIGLSLWNRDLKILSEAFGYSKTLRRLSFSNSGLGDIRLDILAGGIRDCMPLQTLDLSGCALTDASVRCITAIVKGHDLRVDPQPLHEPLISWTIQHRTSKFGDQWRRNLILRGLWSPVRSPENAVTRKTELEWKASLREPVGRRPSSQNSHLANKIPIGNLALAALDLSYNAFTDLLPRELVVALRMGAPLHALNLRFNQMTRVGAKFLLDVMHEFNILRLVDLRGNEDEKVLGVLESGEHYTSFSTFQAPFWLESTSPSETPQKKKRDSEIVSRAKHPIQSGKCNLAPDPSTKGGSTPATATSLSTEGATTEGATPLESAQEISDEVGTNSLKTQPHVPSWDRDWVCDSNNAPPGMIDPPREAVVPEPLKMFTNELYEESTPTNSLSSVVKKEKEEASMSNGCFSSLRNTPRRSCAERGNNKRKIPDSQGRRRSRRARKPPPRNELVARAKNVAWDVVRHQKKSVLEKLQPRALMSSEDIKKEVEWHKFVSEMTETLLTLRDGLDRLIGPAVDDGMLSIAQPGVIPSCRR